jgi:predicted dehydrogenase
MKTRFAFAGFRHGHILDLLTGVEEHPDTEVVACCEEDAATRTDLAAKGRVKVTHDDFAKMLRDVECDVVAIGDYYAKRGAIALAALNAGKHILSDKRAARRRAQARRWIATRQPRLRRLAQVS